MDLQTSIPGYTARTSAVARSPITLADFDRMKKSVLFEDEDVKYLRLSHDVLKDQLDAVLDVWYGFVAATPHLLASFTDKGNGKPLEDYLAAVRHRFARWILDTARAEYDQAWLDYQHEIGMRHHRARKNRTDGASSSDVVPFRDLFLLIFPVTFTLKPFLGALGHDPEAVEKMYQAWVKSCLLQVTLWSYSYVKDGDF